MRSRWPATRRGARRVAVVALAVLSVAVACDGDGGSRERTGPDPLPPVRAGSLEVSGIVMAQPVTGERTALYFDVANTGSDPDTLLSVDVGTLGRASVHRTTVRDGVSRMRAAGPVEVAGGGRIGLRPGGLHVMVEGLTSSLASGDTVPVTLRFAVAGDVEGRARVIPYADLEAALSPAR